MVLNVLINFFQICKKCESILVDSRTMIKFVILMKLSKIILKYYRN
jgi:hypothetical protein